MRWPGELTDGLGMAYCCDQRSAIDDLVDALCGQVVVTIGQHHILVQTLVCPHGWIQQMSKWIREIKHVATADIVTHFPCVTPHTRLRVKVLMPVP
jgi:hypothetical protein